MKKAMQTKRTISSIIILLLMVYFYINTSNGKIIMLPFLICSIVYSLKNVSILINKPKLVNLFDKIFKISFLVFWFVFIVFWIYSSITDKNYINVIFTIPFIIVGIYFSKKILLKNSNSKSSDKKINFDFRIIISATLVLIAFISGILMLFFGIKGTYELNNKIKNYSSIDGYFVDYEIYRESEDGTTYKLIYKYIVDEKEYYIKTDYASSYVPERNSIRSIKYNPNNPEESILEGTNSKNGLIYGGAFFTLVSLTFILVSLSIKGWFDKFKIDIIGAYIGFVIFIIGFGVILLQNGSTMSLMETIKSLGLWIIIPILLIIVGVYQFIKSVFIKTKK